MTAALPELTEAYRSDLFLCPSRGIGHGSDGSLSELPPTSAGGRTEAGSRSALPALRPGLSSIRLGRFPRVAVAPSGAAGEPAGRGVRSGGGHLLGVLRRTV